MSKSKVVMTYGEMKKLGIWSSVCKREQWSEEFWEGKLRDDMQFLIHTDLVEGASQND